MTITSEAGKLARRAYNALPFRSHRLKEVPASYRVVAFISVFNEADIIETTIRHLGESGVQVYVIDNWSTDGSWEMVRNNASGNLIGVERFPAAQVRASYNLQAIIDRVTELSEQIRPDWSLLHDADEYFQAPWPATTLRSALFRAEQELYNAISFQLITFPPVDNSFQPGSDFVKHFQHWTAYYSVPDCAWIRGWKGMARGVRILGGGHDVRFPHRYGYPKKFIIRHYPIRSQAHGERKVFQQLRPRHSAAERARGWHVHYDGFAEGDSFLESPEKLHKLNEDTFLAELREHGPKSKCELCSPENHKSARKQPNGLPPANTAAASA